mgnify:CR=1 FL=1
MKMLQLEECCEILDSMRVPITAKDRKKGPYPYYGANGVQDYVADYIFDDDLVLLAEDGGNFGSDKRPIAYKVSGKCWVNNHAHVLKPKAGMNVDYLCYSLMFYKVDGMVNGATRMKLTQAAMRRMLIPSRTIEGQKAIVRLLNRIQMLIKVEKEQLKKYDELIKSRFVEMFGNLKKNDREWEVCSFTDFAKIDTVMIHDFKGYEDYPHIGINSIEKETGNILSYRTIKEDSVISGKYLFTSDHIIYSKIRPNLNKVALPGFKGLCSADAYPILPKKERCNRIFLSYTMRSPIFLDYILAYSDRTNLPKVNKIQVEGFRCPMPDIALQEQFAIFVHQVDKLRFATQKALTETQQLFDSLMQKYFG